MAQAYLDHTEFERGKKRQIDEDIDSERISKRVASDETTNTNEDFGNFYRIQGDATESPFLIHSLAALRQFNTITQNVALKSGKFLIYDRNIGEVEVMGPGIDWHDSNNSTYRLILSESDVTFFAVHGVCIVRLFTYVTDTNEKMGHALCLIRNNFTGVCELYDPNGSLFTTYTGRKIQGGSINHFTNAVHSGLFGPLVSPKDSKNMFNVVCKSSLKGLQSIEIQMSNPTQYDFFDRLDKETMQKKMLREFVNRPGFCNSWTHFRYFDQYYNNQLLYHYVEMSFIHPNYSTRFENAVLRALLNNFCKECPDLDPLVCKEILTALSLSFFIQLYALFLYVCSQGGHNISELYSATQNTNDNKSIEIFITKLYAVCQAKYGNNVLFGNRKDWEKAVGLTIQTPHSSENTFSLTTMKNGTSLPFIEGLSSQYVYTVSLDTGENKYTIN